MSIIIQKEESVTYFIKIKISHIPHIANKIDYIPSEFLKCMGPTKLFPLLQGSGVPGINYIDPSFQIKPT